MSQAQADKAAAELLKNPQFLAMFQKAMGDEKIPEEGDPNRNEWLKKMQERLKAESEVEAKKQLEAVQSDEDGKWMWIDPSPGFCIKCTTTRGGKVFINIGQHEKIAEPMPLDDDEASDEIRFRIPLSCGAARLDTDKAGKPCKVYDVIVNPATIKRCGEDNEFRRFVAALCMSWIKQKSEPDLNADEFKNVNFKCKGKMDLQRIRLSAPKGGNAMNDEIKLPGESATVPTPDTKPQGRKMVSEVEEKPQGAAASTKKPDVEHTVTPDGLYNWSTHAKPAKNPYFRSSPPARFKIDVTIPSITTIAEVDVQLKSRGVQLTFVDEEQPFLFVTVPFPIAEDPVSAKFVRKKNLLQLVVAVQLPDESDEVAKKTSASRDVCEVEAEEMAKQREEEERLLAEQRAKYERMRKEEEDIMKQRKELVEGMQAIQEGLVPPALAEEIQKMPPEQKRHMMARIESRKKTGDGIDQLLEKLPEDALNAISNLIRHELGLEPLKAPAAKKPPPQPAAADTKKGKADVNEHGSHADAAVRTDDRVVEYNFAKKAETLFGVTMYNRYTFALDH